MLFDSEADRALATAIAELVYCNPFLPERIAAERKALGEDFVGNEAVWSALSDSTRARPNIDRLGRRASDLAETLRGRLVAGTRASREDLQLYEDLILYLLFEQSRDALDQLLLEHTPQRGPQKISFYPQFAAAVQHYLGAAGMAAPSASESAHLFACFFQIRRAFRHIFDHIVGRSISAARLRAAVWQSVCTHDLRRYRRVLYNRMGDITTLITGPSGTGKELVARALGLSRYVPFDPKAGSFTENASGSFHPLNLSALSPTLIESELFGHRRGAFTGALQDRAGWLEVCRPLGTVFLDEVGELDGQIQVKLLRVLQTRTFQRLGDTAARTFHGKIIAATNRNLAEAMQQGRFRTDFYYRLCSDMITTPSLAEQLRDAPDDLPNLVLFITKRLVGDAADSLADEVVQYIDLHLGRDYAWPGNFRELEQCVRNLLIRKEYRPPRAIPAGPRDALADAMAAGTITADQLLRRYVTMIYAQTGSYEETARRLALDRRTVKAKIDQALLSELSNATIGWPSPTVAPG